MELAIYRKKTNKLKITAIFLAVVCLACLVPATMVFASALTDPTIGMTGVNNSDLTVGMTGVNNGDLLLDFDAADWHLNPSEYPIALAIPVVFFAVALLMILNMILADRVELKTIIYVAILISVALAMLASIQLNTNSLWGG